jgi:3-isopropylmalate/(R)-2-methylmalate dehydratase small subunit
LLEGLDDIDISLEKSKKISSYEKNIMKKKPWLN